MNSREFRAQMARQITVRVVSTKISVFCLAIFVEAVMVHIYAAYM